MPVAGLQGWHLAIILLLVLLLFGAPKLPQLAKSLGQSMRIFRGEMREMKQESQSSTSPTNRQASSTTNNSTATSGSTSVAPPEDATDRPAQ